MQVPSVTNTLDDIRRAQRNRWFDNCIKLYAYLTEEVQPSEYAHSVLYAEHRYVGGRINPRNWFKRPFVACALGHAALSGLFPFTLDNLHPRDAAYEHFGPGSWGRIFAPWPNWFQSSRLRTFGVCDSTGSRDQATQNRIKQRTEVELLDYACYLKTL